MSSPSIMQVKVWSTAVVTLLLTGSGRIAEITQVRYRGGGGGGGVSDILQVIYQLGQFLIKIKNALTRLCSN